MIEIRRFMKKIILVLLNFLMTVAFAVQSSYVHIPLRDYSRVTVAESINFIQMSLQTNHVIPRNQQYSTHFQRYGSYYENHLLTQPHINPQAESFDITPNIVQLGDIITLNIPINESLHAWYITQGSKTYRNLPYTTKTISFVSPVTDWFESPFSFTLSMKDAGGNQFSQLITINIRISSLNQELYGYSIENDVLSEVHVGKQGAKALEFSIRAISDPSVIDMFSLSINTEVSLSYISKIALYCQTTSNAVLVTELNEITASSILLPITTHNILSTLPTIYFLTIDLSDTIPTSVNISLDLGYAATHRLTSASMTNTVTLNLIGKSMMTVPAYQPIIVSAGISDYIGNATIISPNLVYEILSGRASQINYNVFDLDNYTYTGPWQRRNFQSVNTEINDRFRMINNALTGLLLKHGHHYQLVYDLESNLASRRVTSNAFLVDLTVPQTPQKPNIPTQNPQSILPQVNNAMVPIHLELTVPQTLDWESGIQAYRVLERTSKELYWKVIIENTVTQNTLIQTDLSKPIGSKYYYKITVQNKAGNWSNESAESEIECRDDTQIIDALFNVPNPFDSRRENTTIYYTLHDPADVDVTIYDLYGYFIYDWSFKAGMPGGTYENSIIWNGTNANGMKIAKGIYALVLKVKDNQGGIKAKRFYKIAVIH